MTRLDRVVFKSLEKKKTLIVFHIEIASTKQNSATITIAISDILLATLYQILSPLANCN